MGDIKEEFLNIRKIWKKVDSGEELSASTSERTDTLPNHVFWGLSRANTPGLTHKINSMRYVTDPRCYVRKASVQGPNLKLIHPTRLMPVLNVHGVLDRRWSGALLRCSMMLSPRFNSLPWSGWYIGHDEDVVPPCFQKKITPMAEPFHSLEVRSTAILSSLTKQTGNSTLFANWTVSFHVAAIWSFGGEIGQKTIICRF